MSYIQIKFSDIQQKELIDAKNGKCLGFVMDAFVNVETGMIEYFLVEVPKKFYEVTKREGNIRKIFFGQVVTIGVDVILITTTYD